MPETFVKLEGFQLPLGTIFSSTSSVNPATLLGYGTWTAFGAGKVLVSLDAGDVDFDTVEETGGAKTHKHSTNIAAFASGTPDKVATVDNNADLSTVQVAAFDHAHGIDPPATDSDTVSNVPPYIVVYMWKRTA